MAYNKTYKPSKNSERETPYRLYSVLYKQFGFTLDAAATKENTKCERYIDKSMNALDGPWHPTGSVWLNPPYSRGLIGPFMEMAWRQIQEHKETVVCLVPADPSTRWWRYNVLDAGMHMNGIEVEIRFLTQRVRFLLNGEPMTGGAMTPNAIVIYRYATRSAGSRYTRYWNWELDKYY